MRICYLLSITGGDGNIKDVFMQCLFGCASDLAVTSVTPLIVKVDSADLAGWAGVLFLPHGSMCIPPKAMCTVEEDHSLVEGIQVAAQSCQNI